MSAPLSVAIAIGRAIIAIVRLKVRPDPDTKRDVGCIVLGIANVIAPGVLLVALGWGLAL